MTAARTATVTEVHYFTRGDVVRLMGRPATEEYIVIRQSRVNYVARRVSNGKDYSLRPDAMVFIRKGTKAEIDSLNPTATVLAKGEKTVRIGRIVTAVCTHRKWNFSADQKFVVLNMTTPTRAKIIELGGNDLSLAWTLPASQLTVVD